MIRGICLDLFHTLVDVGTVPDEVGRYTADILGIGREEWNEACFGPAHDICRPSDHYDSLKTLAHSIDPSIDESLIREAVVERQRRFDHALVEVDDETLDALRQLRKRGLKLALVSNASSGEVSAWQRSPMAELFDTATFSCDVGSRKPAPDIYHHALNALGLKARDCLFVGDGGSDEHLGASEVGLTPVLITRFIQQSQKLETQRGRVQWEIGKLSELGALLNSLELGS
ncbi:MAG: HAD family hydrolase [Gammaproteobacteria bacterium]|nr:HAD family hydrolase [Gammaproteobacteria bacterium]